MPPPRTDHLDAAYPVPLRTCEANAVEERRKRNGIDPERPLVGVALSGGGIRSATFCLGLFQALARQKLVRKIDFLSTVSGGGYFGSFLGAACIRPEADVTTVEEELADNHSWSVQWLRNNGRFLSPNGSGDSWLAAAVAVRNWIALHVVLLTFGFFVLSLGTLIRADLWTGNFTQFCWSCIEQYLSQRPVLGIFWSPWITLPLIPLVLIAVPTGTVYWFTQFRFLMGMARRATGIVRPLARKWTDHEFAARAQIILTRSFMVGLVAFIGLLIFATIDSLGQTLYFKWANAEFAFPSLWAGITGAGVAAYSFGAKIFIFVEGLLGKKKLRLTFDMVALGLAMVWLLFIVVGLSVVACGFAWNWNAEIYRPMEHGLSLSIAVFIAFVLSWWFSRSFTFVNLSSMQQVYAARLRRAYLGATNPERRRAENYSMTDLMPGDDVCVEDYFPHRQGGPLHLINVTVNETISGKTQIERQDRKGLAMAVSPCGLSVGTDAHALWAPHTGEATTSPFQALWEERRRKILAIPHETAGESHALHPRRLHVDPGDPPELGRSHKVEALSLGRWIAISGAAFTTGTGARTQLGLSLLLGLANVRLGYWWDSGIKPSRERQSTPPTFIELFARVVSWVLPVQACLMSEFFARFHGPARRHWYLSDGGHFENTGCYELIRRRVPFIICSDNGQDPRYQFADLANLVRKARTDFGADIQVLRRAADTAGDDPGVEYPLPKLESVVHPSLLDVIGTPEDFPSLLQPATEGEASEEPPARPPLAKHHALLARIHYTDTNEFSWLLVVKPSLMGDEAVDVVQYHQTHPLFPQEPTSDQYFDEAQWESYRKLGEHIGVELFTPPPAGAGRGWSPSEFKPPTGHTISAAGKASASNDAIDGLYLPREPNNGNLARARDIPTY